MCPSLMKGVNHGCNTYYTFWLAYTQALTTHPHPPKHAHLHMPGAQRMGYLSKKKTHYKRLIKFETTKIFRNKNTEDLV